MAFEFFKSKDKETAKNAGLKYTPKEGIRFTDLLKEPLKKERVKYTPGQGINFSEILKEKQKAKKEPLMMSKKISILSATALTSAKFTTKKNLRKKHFLKNIAV